MTAEDRVEIKLKIENTIVRLREEILELEEQSKPIPPENAIGRLSRMDAINNRSVILAALRQSKSRMTKLESALIQVELKNFGICARCGEPIPIPRLKFRPESTRCVNCADK